MLKRFVLALISRSLNHLVLVLGFVGLFVGIGLFSVHPSAAQDLDLLKQQQQQIEQQKAAVQQERDRVKVLEKRTQSTLKGIRKNIQATATQIQTNESKLKHTQQVLQTLEQSLTKAETSFRQKQVATASRLRFLQRQQGANGWAVLLESQNLNDFLDRRHQLKRIYEQDRKILTTVQREAERLDRQRRQVEQTKNDIDLLTQELQAQKADYEQQAKSQKQVADRLKADRRALEAAEAQLAKDSQGIGSLIQRKLAEARARNAKNPNAIVILGTGQLALPSDGSVTSEFGWRTHPILGYSKFHSGMDFGADYGDPIRAADRGTVIFAGWYGGYGNAAIVDHGNGMTTLYAHSSELYVSEGQSVERGQAIAATGSTGFSTGPHLHFEVRKEGEPIDPAGFL